MQKRWGLTVDSKIGSKTWNKASARLRQVGGSTAAGRTLHLVHAGQKSKFELFRSTKGRYALKQDGGTRVASCTDRTCK